MNKNFRATVEFNEKERTIIIHRGNLNSNCTISAIMIRLSPGTESVVNRAIEGMYSQEDDFCRLHASGIGDSEKF